MATNSLDLEKPPGQQPIVTIEMHTCCEPVRIVRTGYPNIEGDTILEKRRFVSENLDYLRSRLMHEPRGGSSMYGVIPVAPHATNANMAVLFMDNGGYSTMCGHAVISLGRYALDYGIVAPVAPETKVNIQCPCGTVSVVWRYTLRHSIRGAFYAIATAKQFGLDLKTASFESLRSAGAACSEAVKKQIVLEHPVSEDLAFLYGTVIFDDNDSCPEGESSNFCVFADAQVDRSPCGSAVTARVAIQVYKHSMQLGKEIIFSGPAGGRFTARALREEQYSNGKKGVVVEVSGHGFYTGICRFSHEREDTHCNGYMLK